MEITIGSFQDWMEIWELEKRCYTHWDVFKPRQIKYLLLSPTCRIFVFREKEKISGYIIGLQRHFCIPSGRIYKIAVDSQSRGKGIASKLMDEMEAFFRRSGQKKVCAEIRKGNSASQKLFEKKGYIPFQILEGYYPDGEAAIKLWKKF